MIKSLFTANVLWEKWVFKLKKKINEEIVHHKTSWVVRDFDQVLNINYDEIFILIIKSICYKILFVIVVVNDSKIEQMNVKTIFLYKNIDDDMWIEQFYKFENNADRVCKLIKTLYKFKQTSQICYNTLIEFLITLNFKSIIFDFEIFINEYIFIIIYIDNFLIIDFNRTKIQRIKNALSKRFYMIDLNFCSYYLNIQII